MVRKNDSEFIFRKCPSCESSKATLAIASAPSADEQNFNVLKQNFTGFFKRAIFFKYYRCNTCGQLYNQKFFSAKKLSELYSSMPDNTAGQDLSSMKKTQEAYFKFFNAVEVPRGGYIEFGPDIGLFSEHVAKQKNFSKHYFIEPNKSVHVQLMTSMRQASEEKRRSYILTDLGDLSSIPDNSAAAAVMIHVLDHMIDPKTMLKNLHRKMVPGAVLTIVTHDEGSLLAKILRARFPAYCLQHPHLFSKKTTKTFLETCGFKDVVTAKSKNYFAVPYLLQHLLYAVFGWKFKPRRYPSWMAIGLKLGNIITVAKK